MSQDKFQAYANESSVIGEVAQTACSDGTTWPLYLMQHSLRPLRQQLVRHQVYGHLQTLTNLHVYMEHHVFAVWDFMSLLKSLQGSLTCVEVPWHPTVNRLSRRLINEIVLAEESDDGPDGSYISHFELYLNAMRECGADTSRIESFLALVQRGEHVLEALDKADAPIAAKQFVRSIWKVIETRKPHKIAAAFTLGREEIIPDMFKAITSDLHAHFSERLGLFNDYLLRHIQLDEEHHTPLALAMLKELCGNDERKVRDVAETARQSLKARLNLWDGVTKQIQHSNGQLLPTEI